MRAPSRFCPDCGSPAEGDPCWFYLRREYDGGRWGFWIDAPGGSRFYHRNWQSRDEAEAGRGEFAKGLEAAEERVNVVLAQVVSQFDNPA